GSGREIARAEEESWAQGQLVEIGVGTEQGAVTLGHLSRCRRPGRGNAKDDGRKIRRRLREGEQRVQEQVLESPRHAARGVEVEPIPDRTQQASGDRPAGDGRDGIELAQIPELVETGERAGMKQHGPIAAARQAQAQLEIALASGSWNGLSETRRNGRNILVGDGHGISKPWIKRQPFQRPSRSASVFGLEGLLLLSAWFHHAAPARAGAGARSGARSWRSSDSCYQARIDVGRTARRKWHNKRDVSRVRTH